MLTELCQELRNWFVRTDADKHVGTFKIENGSITADFLVPGQYYRIIGSIFNDGVHQIPFPEPEPQGAETQEGELEEEEEEPEDEEAEEAPELIDETFNGAVWAMAIPKAVINLAAEIAAWRQKYESASSPAMSPFMSESFAGYSYSKGASNSASGNGGTISWKTAFAPRLNAWRKL